MKAILILFAIIIICAAKVRAQDGGFFIPQQTVEMMNRTEQLPPMKTMPQDEAEKIIDLSTENTSEATAAKKPKTKSRKITFSNSRKPAVPEQKALKTEDSVAPKTAEKPLKAQKPMVPQTGTPAVPVYADNPDNIDKSASYESNDKETNTKAQDLAAKVAKDTAKIQEQEEKIMPKTPKMTYDKIIEEYSRDIQKISENQPTENKRLEEVLKKYHDETITF